MEATGAVTTTQEPAVSNGSLAAVFAGIANLHGDRTALTLGGEQLSYAELDRRAESIAAALQQHGVAAGEIVALYLDRSFGLIAAMLGVWKAGCAYLPIDVTSPVSRTEHILSDSRATVVLTDRAHAGQLSAADHRLIAIDGLAPSSRVATAWTEVSAESLAYVIYTSGSTGKPKGVMVSHHNLRRLLTATEPWFHFSLDDVWTMFHSSAFDFSVWEIWGCLLYGGRLVIVPYLVSRTPEDFYGLLADERVTVLNQTPTALCMLIDAERRVAPRTLSLRLVILGGEALQLPSLLPFFQRHGAATPQIVNMYGITETTVHVTARIIREADALVETDSLIGTPIPDLTIHLLNEALQPVSPGETGELCIGGAGVSLGYLHQPELTASRFIADPYNMGGTLYRSGDLGRMRADGELVYLGRSDNQVKISGFRIELGEVEAVLAACPGVAQICVVAHQDAVAGPRLAAYFTTTDSVADARTVSAYAEQHLAAYMRPAFYRPLATMPINGNGKIDRTSLPSPVFSLAVGMTDGSESLTPLEDRIAAAWRCILNVEHIDPDTNIFDAGGNSLLVVALRNRLQKELERDIPVTWMFEATTIRSFARLVESSTNTAASSGDAKSPQSQGARQRNAFAALRSARRTGQ